MELADKVTVRVQFGTPEAEATRVWILGRELETTAACTKRREEKGIQEKRQIRLSRPLMELADKVTVRVQFGTPEAEGDVLLSLPI
jgi:hypothetical protein